MDVTLHLATFIRTTINSEAMNQVAWALAILVSLASYVVYIIVSAKQFQKYEQDMIRASKYDAHGELKVTLLRYD